MNWEPTKKDSPKIIYEVPGATNEPIDIYRERYISPVPNGHIDKLTRYYDNAIRYMDYASSMLVFGSGHPGEMNNLKNICLNIGHLGCVDFIIEAGLGLKPDIRYYNINILESKLPSGYDYIFTSHTLEHFTREELLNVVIPRLMAAARKAVVAIVPYGDAWKDEPSHKCRFYEDDELAALASKYKIILDGHELVLWID